MPPGSTARLNFSLRFWDATCTERLIDKFLKLDFPHDRSFPKYLAWLQYFSWMRYGYEAMSIVHWRDIHNISQYSSVEVAQNAKIEIQELGRIQVVYFIANLHFQPARRTQPAYASGTDWAFCKERIILS
jgi:hypothetical protein